MTEVAGNTVVDGRYRVLRRLGSGGMADVYCAEDTHLGRQVAIKILHRRFAQDQEFVERFRREAKAAAGLQHPNVVGVFDRGEHEGTYYIAMEFLEGRTLKDIAASEAPLPQERVIDLGLQILQAAGFAHRHGVIHRDFKPHNVIVEANGHAKVTDFGIARAGASEMTETGSIMGTAQYLSPEQAQGHAVTATSDIYSIGVMLYEMLAGRLPFDGDSAVAVALKHLSEQPAPISQWRPDVHPALEAVVMAALAKDPEQRWQSAEDLAAGLEGARAQIEAGPNGGQDTAAFAAIPMPETAPTQVAVAPPAVVAPVAGPDPQRERRWPWYTIGFLALALLAVLLYLVLSGLLATEKRDVPRVTGKPLVTARQIMERAGFQVQTERVQSAQPFDQVVDQDPNPGEQAEKGSTVTLEVSGGPGEVLVPPVENLSLKQALDELDRAGLKVTIDREFSNKVKDGFATRTVPPEGVSVTKGTRVRLLVSRGPEQVTVPDVTGLSRDSAETRLRDEGLKVAVEEEASDEPEGDVISQSPSGGTELQRGATVTITVSTGKVQVAVPDVFGDGERRASARISAAGLTPVREERTVTDPTEDGRVIEQRPPAGTEVDKGSEVVIVIGVLQQDDTLEPAPGTP
ncbi:MAG: eukaryotic-like serine/threonine-protein kinase [Thermoleophilaceae bacterium]|jgi:serine/threonine-protein kinase|nr:eukaryotic-like serine/threonine-protein kinase [Thermoleophilaceae bacterium]